MFQRQNSRWFWAGAYPLHVVGEGITLYDWQRSLRMRIITSVAAALVRSALLCAAARLHATATTMMIGVVTVTTTAVMTAAQTVPTLRTELQLHLHLLLQLQRSADHHVPDKLCATVDAALGLPALCCLQLTCLVV